MTLIKTSLLNAIAVFIKMLTLLGINKVIAIYVGPMGYAAVGQFQNAIQMVTTLGTGAVNSGIIKYTAEFDENLEKQIKYWSTAGAVIVYSSLICSFFIFAFNNELALYFLKNDGYKDVFTFLAISIPFLTLNSFLLSILNGKKEISRYVIANIFGSLLSIIIVSMLAEYMKLKGILIALATYQSFSFLSTLYICKNLSWFRFSFLFGRIDKNVAKRLLGFATMTFVAAITAPLCLITVREILSIKLGIQFAGYWEAMWRLSSAYLMFATTTLGVYFLPKLSSIRSSELIFQEINKGYKLVIPLLFFSSLIIYLVKDFLILALFSKDFLPMEELFLFQLIGDILKIGGWIVAFVMISKAMIKEYVITQISFSIVFPFLTLILTDLIGFQGVAVAHFLNYGIYWVTVSYLVNKRFKNNL